MVPNLVFLFDPLSTSHGRRVGSGSLSRLVKEGCRTENEGPFRTYTTKEINPLSPVIFPKSPSSRTDVVTQTENNSTRLSVVSVDSNADFPNQESFQWTTVNRYGSRTLGCIPKTAHP